MTPLQRVKRSFSQSAKSYAEHGTLQKEVSEYLVKVFVSPKVKSPSKILDVGCGTGFTSLEARKRWKDSFLTAIDIAEPMVRETNKAGILDTATANASELPFKDGSFDLIISSLSFQWISHDDNLFREMARVLKKGGHLVFSTLGPGTLGELQSAYDKACQECTGKPAQFKPLMGEENLMDRLSGAGFSDKFAMFNSLSKSYPSVDALFKMLKGVGATLPGRPDNPPRRDILAKTVQIYAGAGGEVSATYELIYISVTIA